MNDDQRAKSPVMSIGTRTSADLHGLSEHAAIVLGGQGEGTPIGRVRKFQT